jgi:hypothetical protein
MPSPIGTARLLRAISAASGLDFDLAGIDEAAQVQRQQLAKQVSEQPELAAAIAKMEDSHDADAGSARGGALTAEPLPSGDEIAAEFQRFLASQIEDQDGPPFTE